MSLIIKNKNVRFEAATSALHESAGDGELALDEPSATCEKAVRLLESEGLARAIEITCSCGEVTVVELDYADAEAAPAATEETR
ncbi:MAG: hypothetical protein GY711_04365 [bacterium]|nr:hypothetical protein [bacterium]